MGSGKTSVGRELALLGKRFLLDTDCLIEQNMGKSITEIFDSVGESGFRRIESQLISWLSHNVKNAVISTGGGMSIYNDVSSLGKIFWLNVSFEQIIERLDSTEIAKRPLFKNIDQAKKLYNKRKAIYESKAEYVVEEGHLSASHIAKTIFTYIEQDKQQIL